MIISASRRTDIPAYYSNWFFHRLEDGYVMVRTPKAPHRVSRVSLVPKDVEGIVFWTKNPSPMLTQLFRLKHYNYYFQFTLNAYGADVQPNIPGCEVMVPVFRRLSREIGSQRVLWRYDPIFFTSVYTPQWHVHNFERLARALRGSTQRCTISFLDYYKNTAIRMASVNVRNWGKEAQIGVAKAILKIAEQYEIKVEACAESWLSHLCGVAESSCVDGALLSELQGYPLSVPKDHSQRKGCRCVQSIDIGSYSTCLGGCVYCYANDDEAAARKNARMHQSSSPFLIGDCMPQDIITVEKPKMYGQMQLTFETF